MDLRLTADTLRRLTAAIALAAPCVAHADLSAEVLAVHHEAAALSQAHAAGVQVYVGAPLEKLLLRRVQLQIDEQPPLEYEYSSFESAALLRGGLHRMHAGALEPGPHRLRALFIARRGDAQPLTPRIELRIDQPFEKTVQPLSLQLTLAEEGGWRDRAVLRFAQTSEPDAAQAQRAARFAEDSLTGWAAQFEDAPTDLPPVDTPGAASVTRYNDAVATIRGGSRDAGVAALTQIATGDAAGADARRVRDLANLTLGYELLRERRAAEAADALRRVRSPGPYGNAALLALGWTWLLPKGAAMGADAKADAGDAASAAGWWPQDAAGTPDPRPELRRRMPFRYNWSVAAGERERDLHAALVPWNELSGRDPLDPVVQEGMLVIAYALQHLGAHEQAQRHYLRSIERLQQAGARLDDALAQTSDGRMLALVDAQTTDGWRRWLADLPYDDATAYVRILVDDAAVVDALEARRPLLFQHRLLAQHAQTLEAVREAEGLRARIGTLAQRVDAALDAANAQLTAAAQAALQARARITRGYLGEARFAVARMHDPSPRAAQRVAAAGGAP
ncbi:MAG: hypothetical protein WC809_13900 [Sinimarinibacterium sp.]|jgi:hypothetical protein